MTQYDFLIQGLGNAIGRAKYLYATDGIHRYVVSDPKGSYRIGSLEDVDFGGELTGPGYARVFSTHERDGGRSGGTSLTRMNKC